jgi:hypothetical protein
MMSLVEVPASTCAKSFGAVEVTVESEPQSGKARRYLAFENADWNPPLTPPFSGRGSRRHQPLPSPFREGPGVGEPGSDLRP